MIKRIAGTLIPLLFAALALAPQAGAAAGPAWHLASLSNTTVAPGGELTYYLSLQNTGDEPSDGSPLTLNVTLPPPLTGVSANTSVFNGSGGFDCSAVAGATGSFACTGTPTLVPGAGYEFQITVAVASNAAGTLLTAFDVEGGGAASPAHTVDPTVVSTLPPPFGFDAFDASIDTAGAPYTQAAGHPAAQSTAIDFATRHDPGALVGDLWPIEDVKDVSVQLPPGLLGNPSGLDRCTLAQLQVGETAPTPTCPVDSQVGTAEVRIGSGVFTPLPVYNMTPPPGAPARLAFNILGTIVTLDAQVRPSGNYAVEVTAANIPQALAISGNALTLWGVPADPAHKAERNCPGQNYIYNEGESCEAEVDPAPFFRNPTSCPAPGEARFSARIDSWQQPGALVEQTIPLHGNPGYPQAPAEWGPPLGFEGCGAVPFEPTLDTSLSTNRADSPTGMNVDVGLPADCWAPKDTAAEAEAALCQSDLREAKVTLPAGMSLNPSAADGLAGCSPAQAGLTSAVGAAPVGFDDAPMSCPDASKIGTVEIETPLLAKHYTEEGPNQGKPILDPEGNPVLEPLKGSVYLAEQGNNPFGSLAAMYLVAEGSGVVIKQAGEISLDPETGQVTTTFTNAPQQPFSKLHVELFGGQRAALRTPGSCGSFATHATLAPWSGNPPAELQSSFQVDQGCGAGFDPKLQAGTQDPLAGKTSPFVLRITRDDASPELGSLKTILPPGLTGYLKGIPYCPDSVLDGVSEDLGTGRAQEGLPSCPKASQVGTVTAGAGAGANPFYTSSGRAYLAGPYKGAPLSLAVVAPAVAGPFDLGSVVVRNAIHVDPSTAQLTIDSDPLPHILHGIPLDLRDVRVAVDRDHFTLNPTSCEPMQIGAQISSTAGQSANPSVHFQAAGCDRLGFKPRLSLSLSGPTHRAAHPRLRAVLRARPGDANIGGATVLLPKTELLENAHIRTICTRVQFAAAGGGGAGCPKGSVYGYARAWSPLLDQPLQGPVYLRANGGERELPDLVASLGGQIHVDLVGYIDSVNERIRNRFAIVPDAPVSKFELTMQGGSKGLLANNTNLCRAKPHAGAQFLAHNNKLRELQPLVKAQCGKKSGHKKRSKH